jgi:hypothetical protein
MIDASQLRSRRNVLGAALGTVAVSALVGSTRSAEADTGSAVYPIEPLLGSWLVQVKFVAGPRAGTTEQSLITFTGNGGLVEIDGTTAQAHAGAWARLGPNHYQYTLIELNYNPDSSLVSDGQHPTIVRPQVQFALDVSGDTFHSTSDVTTIYFCVPSPTGGIVQSGTAVIPNVSLVTGLRIGLDFEPPTAFPF